MSTFDHLSFLTCPSSPSPGQNRTHGEATVDRYLSPKNIFRLHLGSGGPGVDLWAVAGASGTWCAVSTPVEAASRMGKRASCTAVSWACQDCSLLQPGVLHRFHCTSLVPPAVFTTGVPVFCTHHPYKARHGHCCPLSAEE